MNSQPALSRTDAVICLSHLRWNFVFQRPQHLMTRCARERPVYFFEEPVDVSGAIPRLNVTRSDNVTVVVPELPAHLSPARSAVALRGLLDQLIKAEGLHDYLLWYYTPMALAFSDHLTPSAIIYDCMDELSAFKGASSLLKAREKQLMARAHLVLTGGQSLYEAKKHAHHNIHPFPSSVDVPHFANARRTQADPSDQAPIGHPRIGFFGVIDERTDLALLDGVAAARPDWNLVMVGPVVKIDPASLPAQPNIHYLGSKSYPQLPAYIAGWDVAMLPFARNEATRFISPTKTPEYMAAGVPVVSTSIRDVVRPYGQKGLVRIADEPDAFVAACREALGEDRQQRLARSDAFLKHLSWDRTWDRIQARIDAVVNMKEEPTKELVASAPAV